MAAPDNSDRKMASVCHIITRLDCGGSSENTLLTAIGLRQKGYAVDIVCGTSDNPPSLNEKEALSAGVTIIRLKSLVRPISPLQDLAAFFAMTTLLRKKRYAVVHTHTSKAGIIGRFAAFAARPVSRPMIVVHTPHGHIFYGYFSRLLTKVFIWLERVATLWTDMTITLTKKEKRDYLDRRIGEVSKIEPVLSGIDLVPYLSCGKDRQSLRAGIGLSMNHFVIGTVARLVPIKNHGCIIDAAAIIAGECPDMRFVFVGDGELRPLLESQIRKKGLEGRFVFTGWRTDIPECLALFDLFAMCSRNEGMGRAFIEAQAAGVPVIGPRVGGVEEAMDEGKTGFLIDPDNPRMLADILCRLYRDRSIVAVMADACRKFVSPAFSSAVMVDRIDNLYQGLLHL